MKFKSPSDEFMPVDLDPSILGLKYDMVEFLQDKGFTYFSDFTEVEADMGNGELKVYIACEPDVIKPAIAEFAKKNRFTKIYFSEAQGSFKIWSRK